jgi:hypothetical protein
MHPSPLLIKSYAFGSTTPPTSTRPPLAPPQLPTRTKREGQSETAGAREEHDDGGSRHTTCLEPRYVFLLILIYFTNIHLHTVYDGYPPEGYY